MITEKIDGTNGLVYIDESGVVWAGARRRWLSTTKGDDNHGFAAWVEQHAVDLGTLGPGYHYGEWWGLGIQRGYGLKEKRFSLFNTARWGESRPACCGVVPVLYSGLFSSEAVEDALLRLRIEGSLASPGFTRPEGVVVFHEAARVLFKKTLEKDEVPKGAREA